MHIAIVIINIIYAALILGWLLFTLTHNPCSDYSRVATIRSVVFIQGNMVCHTAATSVFVRVHTSSDRSTSSAGEVY